MDEDPFHEEHRMPEYDDDAAWWGESEWPDDGSGDLKLKEVDEAYAVADGKLRTFIQARRAVKAQRLSRGFYPFQPGSKGAGRKGKGKGKSKKGKHRPAFSQPSSTASATTLPAMQAEAVYAMRPGDPSYTGCFICGDKGHSFRECPRRKGKGKGKAFFNASGIFTVMGPEDAENNETDEDYLYMISHPSEPNLARVVGIAVVVLSPGLSG